MQEYEIICILGLLSLTIPNRHSLRFLTFRIIDKPSKRRPTDSDRPPTASWPLTLNRKQVSSTRWVHRHRRCRLPFQHFSSSTIHQFLRHYHHPRHRCLQPPPRHHLVTHLRVALRRWIEKLIILTLLCWRYNLRISPSCFTASWFTLVRNWCSCSTNWRRFT